MNNTGAIQNPYRPFTDALKTLYDSFVESGFTEEQAYGLTLAYSNEHAATNLYNNERYMGRRRRPRIENLHQYFRDREEVMNEKNIDTAEKETGADYGRGNNQENNSSDQVDHRKD